MLSENILNWKRSLFCLHLQVCVHLHVTNAIKYSNHVLGSLLFGKIYYAVPIVLTYFTHQTTHYAGDTSQDFS